MLTNQVCILFTILTTTHAVIAQENTTLLAAIDSDGYTHSYHLVRHPSPLSWSAAGAACNSSYAPESGRLAVLSQPHIADPVMAALSRGLGNNLRAWIGARKLVDRRELRFYFLNSSDEISSDRIKQHGDCSQWHGLNIHQGLQNVINHACSEVDRQFLCMSPTDIEDNFENSTLTLHIEKRLHSTAAESGISEEEFVYLVRSTSEVTWYQARDVCLYAGGDLAVWGRLGFNRSELINETFWVGARRYPWTWQDDEETNMTFSYWDVNNAEDDTRTCMAAGGTGWVGEYCDNNRNISHFVCETVQLIFTTIPQETTGTVDATLATTPEASSPTTVLRNNLYYIIGGACGLLLIIVIIVVVVVICSRRKKKREETVDYQTRDFNFMNAGVSSAGRADNPRTSPNKPEYVNVRLSPNEPEYSEAAPVQYRASPIEPEYADATPVQYRASPTEPEYANATPVHYRTPQYTISTAEHTRTNPNTAEASSYATTSIEEVIAKERMERHNPPVSKAGNALRGLKKRLSLLMKRDYSESGNSLPHVTMTRQGPDVVPDIAGQSSFDSVEYSPNGRH